MTRLVVLSDMETGREILFNPSNGDILLLPEGKKKRSDF